MMSLDSVLLEVTGRLLVSNKTDYYLSRLKHGYEIQRIKQDNYNHSLEIFFMLPIEALYKARERVLFQNEDGYHQRNISD